MATGCGFGSVPGTPLAYAILASPQLRNSPTYLHWVLPHGGPLRRAGLDRATCHQLRHTCLTRLREAGMALEAIQAQAGHASIESTRIYLHLGDDWLAGQYRRAAEALDAQVLPEHPATVRTVRSTR